MNSDYLRQVTPSSTLLINEQSRALEATGKHVFKFGFGESPFPPPSVAIEALKTHAGRKEYTPVQGIPELRESVAIFHNIHDGLSILPDNIFIAPGSKILIFSIMMAFRQADILICEPAWVSYGPQAKLLGHEIISIPSSFKTRWHITPQALESALASRKNKQKPAILILNNPGNPDGLAYSRKALQELAKVLKKYRVTVIADEIYGMLHHQGGHVSMASVLPEQTIVTTGLSKWAGAGGWRLGVALLPAAMAWLKQPLLGIASETYTAASTPVQLAATAAYRNTAVDYLTHQRAILSTIGQACHALLSEAGCRIHKPEAAFYLLVDFSPAQEALLERHIHTSEALCASLLEETGVALLPASAFGMPPEYLAARLAYVHFDGAAALRAVEQYGHTILKDTFLRQYCPMISEGMERISDWFKNKIANVTVAEKFA